MVTQASNIVSVVFLTVEEKFCSNIVLSFILVLTKYIIILKGEEGTCTSASLQGVSHQCHQLQGISPLFLQNNEPKPVIKNQ